MEHWPLAKHLPPAARNYCYQLWQRGRFHLKLTGSRKSKLGDYSFDRLKGRHTITINLDINPYEFLLTYLHEVAHCSATRQYGYKVKAHGPEWQATFRELLQPMLDHYIFPLEILELLKKHIRSPKASSRSDLALAKALHKYDDLEYPPVYLEALQPGDRFQFNDQVFEKRKDRRTRVLCKLIPSGKLYLISKMASVEFLSERDPAQDQGVY